MVLSIEERLKKELVEKNFITEEEYSKLLVLREKERKPLLDIFENTILTKGEEILFIFSDILSLPFIDVSRVQPEPKLLDIIPASIALYYNILPISKFNNILTIATSDPLNVVMLDDLKRITGYRIKCAIALGKDIQEAIKRVYYGGEIDFSNILSNIEDKGIEAKKTREETEEIEVLSVEELLNKISNTKDIEVVKEETLDIGEIAKEAEQAPLVKLVDSILLDSYKKRASDIHFEPYENGIRLRYRIDGVLHEEMNLPKKIQGALTVRLKIISGMDITERRVPQDGRFKIKLEGKEIDYRVNSIPVIHGEKIVLRILDKKSISIGLENLGFLPDSLKKIQDAIAKPYGMILVTGPTGSGKSTTLYSILNKLNTPDKNIMTIEDPVEYQVEGITQMAVKPEIGLTFASGLRSLLRQSPDIILVGEIRDFETADIAVKAALTGQLVLSTLHTNDAASAITRLIDMGVEPFLVASSVILISAQRLIRKICPYCKEKVEIPQEVLEKFKIKKDNNIFYHGVGCEKCKYTGYFGRIAIAEVLVVDEEIKQLTIEKVNADEIKKVAIAKGMRTLWDEGIENMKMGLTTLEEVLRITKED